MNVIPGELSTFYILYFLLAEAWIQTSCEDSEASFLHNQRGLSIENQLAEYKLIKCKGREKWPSIL